MFGLGMVDYRLVSVIFEWIVAKNENHICVFILMRLHVLTGEPARLMVHTCDIFEMPFHMIVSIPDVIRNKKSISF